MTIVQPAWRAATPDDIAHINRIEAEVHSFAPERPAVWLERMNLFPDGIRMLARDGEILGYGACHPWRLGEVPALDTLMGELPSEPDCLHIHDVALLPEARRRGFGGAFVRHGLRLACAQAVAHLALVSVYGTTTVWGRCGFKLSTSHSAQSMQAYGETARYMVADVEALAVPGRV